MKVAIVTDRIPTSLGGASTMQEDVLAAVIEVAPATGHEICIAGPMPGRAGSGGALPVNVSLVDTGALLRSRFSRALKGIAPGLGFALQAAGVRPGIDRRLARWAPDLLWFLTPAFLETDLPYFYTLWDLQHRRQPWFPEVSSRGRWAFRELTSRQAIQRAARVIVPNAVAEQELHSFYGILAERCLRLAHPTPSFALDAGPSGAPSATVAKHLSHQYVLYPARFWPHKNHTTLLEALRIMQDKFGREIHAVFPGSDAGNRDHVSRRAALLGLGTRVHFPGFISRDELVHLYRGALALAFPSHFGPENLPPLEAMALGCPVIAADVPGIREQLGDAALLADPLDPNSWAMALMTVIEQPQTRSRLVAAGELRARALSPKGYVRAVFAEIDRFARIRDCWPAT